MGDTPQIEANLASLGVVARGDRELRGVDGAAPLHLQEGWRLGLDDPTHGALQLACFLIELQPGPGERLQGRKQRPGDVVFRIRAARPQFPVQARSLERPVFGPDPLRGRHQEGAYGVGYAGHGVDVYGSRHRKGAQALNPPVVGHQQYEFQKIPEESGACSIGNQSNNSTAAPSVQFYATTDDFGAMPFLAAAA